MSNIRSVESAVRDANHRIDTASCRMIVICLAPVAPGAEGTAGTKEVGELAAGIVCPALGRHLSVRTVKQPICQAKGSFKWSDSLAGKDCALAANKYSVPPAVGIAIVLDDAGSSWRASNGNSARIAVVGHFNSAVFEEKTRI